MNIKEILISVVIGTIIACVFLRFVGIPIHLVSIMLGSFVGTLLFWKYVEPRLSKKFDNKLEK